MIGSAYNLLVLIVGWFPNIQWQTCDAYSGREQVQYCKKIYTGSTKESTNHGNDFSLPHVIYGELCKDDTNKYFIA
jgi:hypothetical protein